MTLGALIITVLNNFALPLLQNSTCLIQFLFLRMRVMGFDGTLSFRQVDYEKMLKHYAWSD